MKTGKADVLRSALPLDYSRSFFFFMKDHDKSLSLFHLLFSIKYLFRKSKTCETPQYLFPLE